MADTDEELIDELVARMMEQEASAEPDVVLGYAEIEKSAEAVKEIAKMQADIWKACVVTCITAGILLPVIAYIFGQENFQLLSGVDLIMGVIFCAVAAFFLYSAGENALRKGFKK